MTVSRRLRYEILRRDNHACRYCGQMAPEIKLTVDHVVPVALGGPDDAGNLVTACSDCNAGKSSTNPDAPLVDDVSADALRWAKATERAAAIQAENQAGADWRRQVFLEVWNGWTYPTTERDEQDRWVPVQKNLPLPAGWRESIDRFYQLGLDGLVLEEAIRCAMEKPNVTADKTFRYFCGVCWGKIREIQAVAAALIAKEDADGT